MFPTGVDCTGLDLDNHHLPCIDSSTRFLLMGDNPRITELPNLYFKELIPVHVAVVNFSNTGIECFSSGTQPATAFGSLGSVYPLYTLALYRIVLMSVTHMCLSNILDRANMYCSRNCHPPIILSAPKYYCSFSIQKFVVATFCCLTGLCSYFVIIPTWYRDNLRLTSDIQGFAFNGVQVCGRFMHATAVPVVALITSTGAPRFRLAKVLCTGLSFKLVQFRWRNLLKEP